MAADAMAVVDPRQRLVLPPVIVVAFMAGILFDARTGVHHRSVWGTTMALLARETFPALFRVECGERSFQEIGTIEAVMAGLAVVFPGRVGVRQVAVGVGIVNAFSAKYVVRRP